MSPEEAEFYPTPAWCVRRLLEVARLRPGLILDPCVGDAAIVDVVEEYLKGLPFEMQCSWLTIDIRPTLSAMLCADYLRSEPIPAHTCIMNPPFSKALAFAQKATRECGHVYMLQRLSWMQSPERAEWLRDHPFDLYVLPERPSFTGDGKTDSAGYGWYRWPSVGDGVRMLASTSKAERQADAVPTQERSQQEMFANA